MNQKDRREAASSQRPRSPRVPVEFALEVEGNTPKGKAFHVKAQAIKISRGGATILVDTEIAMGAVITLTPPFGQKTRCRGQWRLD